MISSEVKFNPCEVRLNIEKLTKHFPMFSLIAGKKDVLVTKFTRKETMSIYF